jgi:hypothetical protein
MSNFSGKFDFPTMRERADAGKYIRFTAVIQDHKVLSIHNPTKVSIGDCIGFGLQCANLYLSLRQLKRLESLGVVNARIVRLQYLSNKCRIYVK